MSKRISLDRELRNRFLRQVHRAPLIDRARKVLGDDADRLLNNMRTAHRLFEKGNADAFESWARNVLRYCQKITGYKEAKRRRAYVNACISDISPPSIICRDEDGEVEPVNAMILFAHAARLSRARAIEEVFRLQRAIWWRWPEDVDRTVDHVQSLLRKASTKRDPIAYLDIVIREEAVMERKLCERA